MAAGFSPDAARTQGSAGGNVSAASLHPSCRGFVGATPNHTLMVEGAIPTLRVLVNAGGADTTLIVQKPDGSFACDDDSDVRNPIVTLSAASGLHRIWIGAYRAGESVPYLLGFHEDARAMTSLLVPSGATAPAAAASPVAGQGVDVSGAEANFGFVQLAPSFAPDPRVIDGTSGAASESSIDAATLGAGCQGHITARPDHVFLASADFAALAIVVRSEGDTTLVVRRPDGSFSCDDDGAGGRNPAVRGPFAAGTYSIWVGSYEPTVNYRYRVGFSQDLGLDSDRL